MEKKTISVRRWAAVGALTAAVMAGVMVGSLAPAKASSRLVPIAVAADTVRPAGPMGKISLETGFAPVVKRAVPAVVSVSSSKMVRTQAPDSGFFSDPFFRQFFGNAPMQPQRQREHSLGSGVIISPDGYILTNNHVVDGATDIKVTLEDRRELPAKVVGRDAKTDIAVLKIAATGLPVLPFGDSSKMEPGDFVLAIGSPFGLSHTVTMGIVSATGRGGLDIEDYEDFIQTDAAINPGNSGGALINAEGELVGINTAILAGGQNGGNEGIGFAIPINMARQVADQILRNGKVVRGYLGAWIQQVTPAIAKSFGLPEARGALVGDVTPDGPGAKAGLKQGDIVLALNGKPINESRELRLQIAMSAPGTKVELQVFRNGKRIEIPVTLGELPSKGGNESAEAGSVGNALSGVRVEELTPDVAHELQVPPGTRGVVVTSVAQASPARDAGLRRGDIIQQVNRQPVFSVTEFNRLVRAAGKQPVLLLVNRGGNAMYVVVQPE
jgi:serine protease Do